MPITHPGFDATSPFKQKNTSVPAELSTVAYLLDQELTLLKREHTGHEAFMDKFKMQLEMAFDASKTCDMCGQLREFSQMRHLPPPQDNLFICEECFENEYFDCHKCKRILPNSEKGEEDNELGYGWFCKDCVKPIGFPQEVIIAPDFPGCEEVAGKSLDALGKYATQATGRGYSAEPEMSDSISLKFVKRLSEYTALYTSQKGAKYEIGELDYQGIGSMREAEE